MNSSEYRCSVCGEGVPPGAPVIFYHGEVVHLACYVVEAAERIQNDSQAAQARGA